MKETLNLFKDVIRHPGRTVNTLQEKSLRLFLILLVINIIPAGALFGYCKFIMDPSILLFWVFAVLVGLLLCFFGGSIMGIYYSISKFLLKEEKAGTDTKVIGYYFFIVFTLYHIVATVVILILVPLHQYAIANFFYDVAHVILIFWIAALSVQAVQKLREETEFRTLLKVFFAVFGGYVVQSVLFLIISVQVINMIFR